MLNPDIKSNNQGWESVLLPNQLQVFVEWSLLKIAYSQALRVQHTTSLGINLSFNHIWNSIQTPTGHFKLQIVPPENIPSSCCQSLKALITMETCKVNGWKVCGKKKFRKRCICLCFGHMLICIHRISLACCTMVSPFPTSSHHKKLNQFFALFLNKSSDNILDL